MARTGKQLDKSVFYDFGPLLSRNGVWNFVVGGRGIGKTYGAKKQVIRNFLRYGDQFIYLRRYKTELEATRTFFADIAHEFPEFGFRVEGSTFQITRNPHDEKPKWETFGYVAILSVSQAKKSVAYPHVTTIIFDEFIIETGNLQYLRNEAKVMLDFFSTVDRYRDKTRVLFLANAISIMNPYFSEYKIEPDADTEWITKHDGFIVCHFPDDAAYANEVSSTRFGKFIQGSDYAKYAIGNKFRDNTQQMIGEKTPRAEYWFSLDVENGRVSIWRDAFGPQTEFYVQEKLPKDEVKRTFDPERMGDDKILTTWSDPVASILRTAFRYGRVSFDSPTTRNRFVQQFKRK